MAANDAELARAFDEQAARFERSPVPTDAAALERLVAFAALPPDSLVLDAGCGPGLVAEAFLKAGHRVQGVDLSGEMIRRARERCARFGDRARFEQVSLFEMSPRVPFDAAVSRFVLHHAPDAAGFLRAQARQVRPGGVVAASDHSTDPDPIAARWHHELECARDRTHLRNLTSGELTDALVRAGLEHVRLVEEDLQLDFDEWFDRGTPALPKAEVRAKLLAGRSRGFDPLPRADGGITIRCVRALVRGVKPEA